MDGAQLTRDSVVGAFAKIRHETCGRVTRVTYAAVLAPKDDMGKANPDRSQWLFCEHSHGHRSHETATKCLQKMYRALPSGRPE